MPSFIITLDGPFNPEGSDPDLLLVDNWPEDEVKSVMETCYSDLRTALSSNGNFRSLRFAGLNASCTITVNKDKKKVISCTITITW